MCEVGAERMQAASTAAGKLEAGVFVALILAGLFLVDGWANESHATPRSKVVTIAAADRARGKTPCKQGIRQSKPSVGAAGKPPRPKRRPNPKRCERRDRAPVPPPSQGTPGQSPPRQEQPPTSPRAQPSPGVTVPAPTPPRSTTTPPQASAISCPSTSGVVGRIEPSAIDEASGIAASRKNPGVLWVHNDSGDSARLFALDLQGRLLGIYNIVGADAWDWEDMAIGPGLAPGVDYLYIGDIGDNDEQERAVRPYVTLYRVPEPRVSLTQASGTFELTGAAAVNVRYPGGPRDAETLMVDPLNRDLYIVSQSDVPSRIYRLTDSQWTAGTQLLTFEGELRWSGAHAGDISPAGNEILVKSDSEVYLYARPGGVSVREALAGSGRMLPYTVEPQGEAIGFCAQGSGYFTVSEGLHQPIYYYRR